MNKILLQINTTVNTGSTGRIAEELGLLALKNGWDSYIAYGRNDPESKSKLIRIGTDWDLKFHGLETRLFDRHALGSVNATIKLVKQIRELKPNIIHLHNLHGYYLNIEVLFKFLAISNIPVIWTFHDFWPMTGHCTYFSFIACDKWKIECYSCPKKAEYPASFGFDRSNKNFHLKKELFTSLSKILIVPVSEWMGNLVKKSYFEKCPIKVIKNGIDTNIFRPSQDTTYIDRYNLQNTFVILGIANLWEPRKGLNDFIQLSKKLEIDCQIILIGLSKTQIGNLPKNIIGLERTENIQELVSFYSTADLFLNLSVEESFGLTTIEALSCGTPVIVYNSTASPELITSETGFVVDKGNIALLIDLISKVKIIGKSAYSKKCIEHANRFFDKNDRFLEYIQLYNSLIV
jgi:glycosyltransferase involved in cell wall biosynthesis